MKLCGPLMHDTETYGQHSGCRYASEQLPFPLIAMTIFNTLEPYDEGGSRTLVHSPIATTRFYLLDKLSTSG